MFTATGRMLGAILFLSAMCLALTTLASAQSLGELARLERERRGSEPRKAKKIYTNDDFPVAAVSETRQSQPVQQVATQSERELKDDQAEVEKKWRRRFAEARSCVRKAEQRC